MNIFSNKNLYSSQFETEKASHKGFPAFVSAEIDHKGVNHV